MINGNASTLQDCAQLGAMLIDIHSQHAHQSLLRRDTQRYLLDDYAGQLEAARGLEQLASDWLRRRHELEELTSGYQPKNDAVEKVFKEWRDYNQSRQKLQQIAEDKKEDFNLRRRAMESWCETPFASANPPIKCSSSRPS